MVSLSHDAQMVYTVLNRNKRQKFRVSPRSSRQANDGYDGAVLLSLRGTRIRFGNLYFEVNESTFYRYWGFCDAQPRHCETQV